MDFGQDLADILIEFWTSILEFLVDLFNSIIGELGGGEEA